MDINEIIADTIKTTVQNELALRMRPLADKQHRDTEEMLRRINELAADLGRWKGKQLEIPHSTMQNIYHTIEEGLSNCAGADGFAELQREVEALRRHVAALDHAKAKDDERFQEDVKSVLDQDNDDARIRGLVLDMLDETEFADALRDRIVEMFNNGAMTISVDKV